MTFNQTVVGSNPTILIIYNFSNSQITPAFININFYWSSLYRYFFNLILQSFIFTTHYYRSFLTTKLFHCFTVQGLNRLNTLCSNTNSRLWQTRFTKLNLELINDPHPTLQSTRIKPVNDKLNTKLFLLYLSYANGLGSVITHLNSNYKVFFLGLLSKQAYPYLNVTKLFQTWTQTHLLLYNLFFNQTQVLIFSTKILQKEAYAFNWVGDAKTYSLFKYSIPFFFLKNPSYGLETDIGFSKLSTLGLETSFITDVRYHYRTVNFLKKYDVYTIGLVPYNTSPWTLHYPIPVSVNNIFVQYFFIKYLFFLKNETHIHYYNTLLKFI